MKKIFLIAFVVIVIILLIVYIRRVRRPTQLMPIAECCENNLCARDFSSSNNLQINGINAWYWGGFETFEEYEIDIAKSKNYGFNHVRFNTMHLMTEAHPDPPTEEERDEIANILKKYYGNNIMPILFTQDRLKVSDSIEKQKEWIDFWLEVFPDVELWDFYNEPIEGDTAFYNRVKELISYMRSKTDANITIGFHDNRPKAFEALHDECDIISYHFYPGHATLYGAVEHHLGKDFETDCDLPEIEGPKGKTLERDPYDKFKSTLDWLVSYDKPFIINEWGFSLQSDSTLEQCQVCYVKNILGIMKDYQDQNLLGHHFYNIREPFRNTVWTGVLRYDGSARPVANVFS